MPPVLILLFGLFAYGLSLNSDFYMDDHKFVLQKEMVSGESWEMHGRGFRAVPFLLWRGVHTIAGPSAPMFHALNLAAHLGTAIALFLCGGALFRKLGLESIPARRAALIGALVFVVHPFASEGVNYMRNLELELVTLFSLLATLCLLKLLEYPRPAMALALAVCSALAIWSKGPGLFHLGATLGLVALAIYRKGAIAKGAKAAFASSKAFSLAAIGGAAILLVPACMKFYGIASVKFGALESDYFWQHALTQGRVFWAYIAKMVAPFGMSSDHLVAWSTSSADFPALLGLVAVVVLAVAVVLGLRKPRYRVVALLIGFTIAPLALRFLYPNGELFVEYRAYPALPFFGLLVGLALSSLYERAPAGGKWTGLALLIAMALLSLARTATWGNAEWLAEDVLEKYPLNNRARTQLQGFALRGGDHKRVFELQDGVKDGFLSLNAENKELPWGRQYSDGRAITNLANGQQLTAMAIDQTAGADEALKFSQKSIGVIHKLVGGDQNEAAFARAAGPMLEVRNYLLQKSASENLAGTAPGEPE